MADEFNALFDSPSPEAEGDFDALFTPARPKTPKPKTVKPSKTSLSQGDLENIARQAGWPETLVPTMGAIGMAESAHDKQGRALVNSYNPGVGHGGKPTTEQSIGPWQINMHPSLGRSYDRERLARDPVYNAKVALELYNQRQKTGKDGLTHWGAYTDGRYKQYLGKGGDPFQSLFGDTGRSASGAPEVSMSVGGVMEPPEPSGRDIALFEQMFGKKVPRLTGDTPVEAPDVQQGDDLALHDAQAPLHLPAAPEAATAPGIDQLMQIGQAAKAGQRFGTRVTSPAPDTKTVTMDQAVDTLGQIGDAAKAGERFMTPEQKRQAVGPQRDTKGNVYTLAPDQSGLQPGQQRRIRDGQPFLFEAGGRIIREGATAAPGWVTGHTPATTPLPADPVLQAAYGQRIKSGIPDTEEFRQKFIQGYNAVKSGQQSTIFTPDEVQFLDKLDLAKTQVATSGHTDVDIQAEDLQQAPSQPQTRPTPTGEPAGVVPQPVGAAQDYVRKGLKVNNGSILQYVQNDPTFGVAPPDGFVRFADGNGQTYLLNQATNELSDESLAQPALALPYQKIDVSVPADRAKAEVAAQLAKQIGDTYDVDKNDVYNWIEQHGITNVGTNDPAEQSRIQGHPGESDTYSLTGRQLNDMLGAVEAERKRKEDYVIAGITKGEIPIDTDAIKNSLNGRSIDIAKLRQNPDFYAASKKAEQVGKNVERLTKMGEEYGDDPYVAKLRGLSQTGAMSKGSADAEIKAYQKAKTDTYNAMPVAANTRNTSLGPWDKDVKVENTEELAARQKQMVDRAMADNIRKYGSFVKFQDAQDSAKAAEDARQKRLANTPMGEWLVKGAETAANSVIKGAVKGWGSLFQGFPVWTKPVANYIDSTFGTKATSIDKNTMYRFGKAINDFADSSFKTDKDYEQTRAGTYGQALGSSLGFMPAAIGGPWGIALYSTMQMTGDSYTQAKQKEAGAITGAKESDAQMFARLNGGLFGWTEILGFGQTWQRLMKGDFQHTWEKIAIEALQEGAEEVFLNEGPQNLGENILAKITYDPNRKWDKGVFDAIEAAGVTAPLTSVLVSALLHVKHAHAVKQAATDRITNGSDIVQDGEKGFTIFNQPAPETEELKPLIEKHRDLKKRLENGINLLNGRDTGNAQTIREQLLKDFAEQTKLSRQIAENAGIPAPTLAEQKDADGLINLVERPSVNEAPKGVPGEMLAGPIGASENATDLQEQPIAESATVDKIGETDAEKRDTQNVLDQFAKYDTGQAGVRGLDLGDRRQEEGTKEGRVVGGGEVTREGQRRVNAERSAETDSLTGLANRSALDRALPAAEADPNTSVIAFDANNFGQINKKVSYEEGDKTLKEIGTALDFASKQYGSRAFRVGGDEFVILAPKDKAEAIRAHAEDLVGDIPYGDFTVSLSGIVGDTFADADSRLQAVKSARKEATAASTPAESEITAPAPTDFVGKTVEVDGEGQGRIAEIRGNKAVVDHSPRKISGQIVYGKRSFFPLNKISVDGGKLSDFIKNEPEQTPELPKDIVPIDRTPEGSSVADERRKEGKFERDGVVYERQSVINESTPRGSSGRVKFSNDQEPEFHYQLIEAAQLQPADLGGNPNPYHFLPEAQPKDRSGKASANASDKIAANLKIEEVGHNPIAYSGAPVTNSRGEVIQGNNRAEGIRKHYGNGDVAYTQQLTDNADSFGFTADQVQGMKEPVLVRMLDVSDADAIRYGNYDVKDIETGGKVGINPVATAARIPFADKHAMLEDVFLGAKEDSTLTQLIKDNSDRIGKKLAPYITEAQSESLFRKGTYDLTPQGAKEIEQLFTSFLFDKGHPSLPDLFDALPHHARQALVGSLPKIFSVPQAVSLVPDIQNGIIAATQFDAVNTPNFNDWADQPDMFTEGRTPNEIYTPVELAIAKLFVESTTQREIKAKFAEYAKAINGSDANLFERAAPAVDKSAAIRTVFDVEYSKTTEYAENQPIAEDTERGEPAIEAAPQETPQTVDEAPAASDEVTDQEQITRPLTNALSTIAEEAPNAIAAESESAKPAVQTTAVAPDIGATFDELVPPTDAEKAVADATEKSVTESARNIEVFGEEIVKNLSVLVSALKENRIEPNLKSSARAAQRLLEYRDDIDKKGADGRNIAADAFAAIQQYGIDQIRGTSTADELSAAGRTFYDAIHTGHFTDLLGSLIEGVDETTAYAPQADSYTGPNMTTVEIAQDLSVLLNSDSLSNIKDARKIVGDLIGEKVESGTPLAKRVDEAVEVALVMRARQIVQGTSDDAAKFKSLVTLYENQPNLNVRTSTSIEQQAYSTPAPLAFVASRLAGINENTTVYEPAAGNGMLLLDVSRPSNAFANEINEERRKSLDAQGFTVGDRDATDPYYGDTLKQAMGGVDVVIANPPFGTVMKNNVEQTWKINDRYVTNKIDHAIALRALDAMKPDGRAVLIVGGTKGEEGTTQRQKGYQEQSKRAFYKTLYDNYNVIDHFTVDGGLYKKQGAGFPVDVIVIDGRGKSARRLPALDVPKLLTDWQSVGEKLHGTDITDQADAGLGLSGMDAEGGRSRPARRGDSREGGTAPDQRTLSDLLGGEGGEAGKQSAESEKSSGTRGTGARGQQSLRPGLDFSDSSEHGDVSNTRQPVNEGETGESGRAVATLGPTDQERSGSGESVVGNRSGELAGESVSIKDKLASAGENTKQSLDEAVKGLADLFGDPNTLGSGPVFSEETYQKAKPHFEAAYNYFKDAAKDAADAMRLLIKHLKEKGWTQDQLRKMKDYIVRFVSDLQFQKPQKHTRPEITPEMAASSTQLVYTPVSAGQPMETLLPANLYTATMNALDKIEKEVGNIDEYVAKKLGYKDNGEIYAYFGGEQIDAVALAVYNMETGGALVLGDATGVGKGRVVAGLLKYAMREGMVPMFFTEKDNLYKDIYRDLVDIGMTDISPLMVDASKAIALDDAKTVWLKTTSGHNNILKKMQAEGEIDPRYNIIFATYYGLQLPNVRREFLRQFAQNTIVVMDESHNAGGDGSPPKHNDDGSIKMNRALTARELVQNAKGVLYSSATWAKRPDVMSLYAKTDMKLAVANPEDLGPAIDRGGVPLQQVVSSMLAESGQYLRRERDFDGIAYDTSVVEVNKGHAENLSKAIRDIFNFSEAVKAHVADNNGGVLDDVMEQGSAILGNPAANAEAIGFAQTMHNVIGQMLLALKVDAAAQEAISDLKADHKPVITMANTMGALIEEYASDNGWTPGDTVDINFGAVLRRYLDKSRHVRVGTAFGESETIRLTDEQLGDTLRIHDRVKAWIDSRDWSDLPASPIDYIHAKLQAAGYKTAEITGRSHALQYNPDGTIVYRIRPGKEKTVQGKTDTILGFNNGSIDVLLLNQSGSTGLSLHASEKFKDQRKRVMTLAQAEGNIDTHMQILGRVNRTGQVVKPGYKQLTADVPAEKRPAAVLAKKMASLNANTTGAIDSAVKAKETLDFINVYGDQIVAQYLTDNPPIHQAIGAPLKAGEGSGLETQDAARKATGRLPMLTLIEQEEFYDAVSAMYESYIEQLNQLGENKLEAQTLPLEAVTTSRIKVFDGPGGESPFGQDAYAETITAKKLTKPRTQEEVLKILQDRLNVPGETNMRNIMAEGREETGRWWREQLAVIKPYIESELDKLDDSDKINNTRTRLDGLKRRLQGALAVAHLGSTVEVKMGSEYYYGVVSDIRRMGRAKTPLALSDYEFTVLTTDASRQLHIPVSQAYTPQNPAPPGTALSATFMHMTSQPDFLGGGRTDIMQAFDHGQNVRTEERTIMTGNLLASFSQFDSGRVINFTTRDGQIRQGILMPMKFNVEKALDDMPVSFQTSDQMVQFLGAGDRIIEDKTGEVRFSHRNHNFSLMVPKAKARGGRFFNNKEILEIANQDFASSGSQMYLRYLNDVQAQDIIDVLRRMGLEFHTNVFKPAAREIVGSGLPERESVAHEKDEDQVAYEQAIARRQEAEARATPFETVEFNHTRTGVTVFVAKYKDDYQAGGSTEFDKWNKLAQKHSGYYSGFSRDGAVPGFLFRKDVDRQAFLDEAKPDTTMFSIADDPEEQDRRNAVRILKQVPLTELAPTISTARTGDRIKLNLPAMELLRRAFEQVDIDNGKRQFGSERTYPVFLGAFTDPNRVEKSAAVLTKLGRMAEQSGMPNLGNQLQVFANDITDASKIGKGTVVFYVLDSKLPQEIFHQGMYLGSMDKALTRRHADAAKLDSSEQFKKADKTFFSKQQEYSVENIMQTQGLSLTEAQGLRNAIIREEVAAWVAEGSAQKIGLTEAEGDDYLLNFMKSFADKVYADAKKGGASGVEARTAVDRALSRFEEIDYAKNAIQSIVSPREAGRNDEEGSDDTKGAEPQEPDEGAQEGAPEVKPITDFDTRVRPEPDASRFPGVRANPGVRGKEDVAKTPRTMRAAGIAADEIIYTVFSDKAAQVEAAAFIDEHGFEGARKLLLDQRGIPDPDVHHAVAAFSIMKVLQDEAARIEVTNPESASDLMQQSVDLGTSLSLRMTRAGRLVRAASVILKNTRSVVQIATAIFQQKHGSNVELPPVIRERVESKGRQAESSLAEHESLIKQMKSLEREVESLKQQLADKAPQRVSKHILANRTKLASEVRSRHSHEISRAVERLQQRALIVSSFSVNATGDEENTLFSIYDEPTLDPQLLEDFANVGADLMLDGLAAPQMMRPSDFDERMLAMFGDVIAPHLETIHRESLRKRNDWLSELAKEKQVKGIIREFGDELSDEEIEAIMQERHDELLRRSAIMRLHNLRAEKGQKIDQLTALEALIAEVAPNPAAAAAATEMVHNKPSAHELYRTLESLGFTGREARDAFREGSEALERAKLLQAKRKAELEAELRSRIDAEESDLADLKTLVVQSRTRARESQREIDKELRRISTGEFGYYKSLVMEAINTPRAIMASTDLSFLLRQGGWFMMARPRSQGAALAAMYQSFGERFRLKGYDTVMAEMELNPSYQDALRAGIDFAGLGKHGEFSITKGEEEFRNNVFGMIAKATEGTAAHKLNIARPINAIITKSDELYTAFLDAQRLATFADSSRYFQDVLGLTFEDNPKEFTALARYINDATGRSDIPGGKNLANLLMNLPLFAPRFTVSRFKLLYKSTIGLPFLPPATRRVVMRDAAQIYAVAGGLVALAAMAGMSAGFDWDDPDFLKIKIGENHIDLFMGMQQALRPTLQLTALAVRGALGYPRANIKLTKERKNDKGEVIGTETYADETYTTLFDLKKGVPGPFLRRKLSPVVSLPIDYLAKEDAVGQPFTWRNAILSRAVPIGVADVAGSIMTGNPTNIALSTSSLLGVGYTRYPDRAVQGQTPAEKMARKINALRFDSKVADEQKRLLDAKIFKLRDQARTGVDVTAQLDQMVAAGEISSADKRNVLSGQKEDYFMSQISSMPSDGLKLVRTVANDGQKAQIDGILSKREETKNKKEERAQARQQLYGGPKEKPNAPPRSLAEKLNRASIEESLILYQTSLDTLSSDQQFDALREIKSKVLNSARRHTLSRENYDAAKKLLGDDLKMVFHDPKAPKPAKGLRSLETIY